MFRTMLVWWWNWRLESHKANVERIQNRLAAIKDYKVRRDEEKMCESEAAKVKKYARKLGITPACNN